jgi:hypothetical protein
MDSLCPCGPGRMEEKLDMKRKAGKSRGGCSPNGSPGLGQARDGKGNAPRNRRPGSILHREVEAWPEAVEGRVLLAELAGVVKRFVVLPQWGPEGRPVFRSGTAEGGGPKETRIAKAESRFRNSGVATKERKGHKEILHFSARCSLLWPLMRSSAESPVCLRFEEFGFELSVCFREGGAVSLDFAEGFEDVVH